MIKSMMCKVVKVIEESNEQRIGRAKEKSGWPELPSEYLLIDTKELSRITGRSVRWLEDHRHKVVSARREGRKWYFNREIVLRRIAAGKSILRGR